LVGFLVEKWQLICYKGLLIPTPGIIRFKANALHNHILIQLEDKMTTHLKNTQNNVTLNNEIKHYGCGTIVQLFYLNFPA
jgi:hypothetical protein